MLLMKRVRFREVMGLTQGPGLKSSQAVLWMQRRKEKKKTNNKAKRAKNPFYSALVITGLTTATSGYPHVTHKQTLPLQNLHWTTIWSPPDLHMYMF